MTDTTTVANHITYDAFGNVTAETDAAVDFLFGYTGRERDAESDLQYNRARYYDAAVGRWISQDPIKFEAGDANLYRYVGNAPKTKTDPSGRITIYDVDDSPKITTTDDGYGTGSYWGIMVALSSADRDIVRQANGAFLIFTIIREMTFYNCDGSVALTNNSQGWMATAVVIYNGEVKMDHTNDPSRDLQCLQVVNNRGIGDGAWKAEYKYTVTVELVPLDRAHELLHLDRFPALPHVPTPADQDGPIDDEVGRDATDRPWRRGADRSRLKRATAAAKFSLNKCSTPINADASSSGTAGSMPRTPDSYPIDGVDIWPN